MHRSDLPDVLLITIRPAKVGRYSHSLCYLYDHAPPFSTISIPQHTQFSYAFDRQAVLVAFEREAAELVVLDLYSFEHDAIGVGSAVRADPPDVDRLEGKEVNQEKSPLENDDILCDE